MRRNNIPLPIQGIQDIVQQSLALDGRPGSTVLLIEEGMERFDVLDIDYRVRQQYDREGKLPVVGEDMEREYGSLDRMRAAFSACRLGMGYFEGARFYDNPNAVTLMEGLTVNAIAHHVAHYCPEVCEKLAANNDA